MQPDAKVGRVSHDVICVLGLDCTILWMEEILHHLGWLKPTVEQSYLVLFFIIVVIFIKNKLFR